MPSLAPFITKYDGKRISGYTDSGGQCIDEVRRFLEYMYGDAYYGIPRVAAAQDFWTRCDLRKWAKHGRSSGFVPQRNAILVMRAFGDNPFGHVAVVRDNSTRNTIYTFDQNFSLYRKCAKERHNVDTRILGYLVKK